MIEFVTARHRMAIYFEQGVLAPPDVCLLFRGVPRYGCVQVCPRHETDHRAEFSEMVRCLKFANDEIEMLRGISEAKKIRGP